MKRKREDKLFSAHAILSALKSSIRLLRWGMIALVLVYLGSGITVIAPNQAGLIQRLGRVLPQIHPPGLLFALPPPIDQVVTVPVKTIQEIALDAWAPAKEERFPGPTLHPVRDPYTLTGDANIIRARFSARFQVSDPINYVYVAVDRDELCRSILYKAACATLAGMSVDDALTTRRDFVSQETIRLAQADIDRLGLGVQLLAFEIREITPPSQVLEAFQDVVSAKVQAKTLVEPANAYRASAIPAAEAKAFSMQAEADSLGAQALAKSKGEASSFLALLTEYRAQPELLTSRLFSETLEETLPLVRVTNVLPEGPGQTRILLAPQRGTRRYDSDPGSTPSETPATPNDSSAPSSSSQTELQPEIPLPEFSNEKPKYSNGE